MSVRRSTCFVVEVVARAPWLNQWFRRAMGHYEAAIENHPRGVEDATLRWNTCARLIERHRHCAPDPHEHIELGLE